ncbi:MAG: exo-alpha-sialidase [Planctomycetaceae bacterium]|nr:exo-alpha-sialidase [Planctomycetaceae bacterium]
MMSDDQGRTWHRSADTIVLPKRGAMEASIAELADGELVMSLRTQLGDLETDPTAEFTNLDCLFLQSGGAVVTCCATRPAWERRTPAMSLCCAVVPGEFFLRPVPNANSRP